MLSLSYEEVEDDVNYRVELDIEVQLVAKLPEKEYGENEFSYREIYSMNGFDEYVLFWSTSTLRFWCRILDNASRQAWSL